MAELAIPLVALGGLYVISNHDKDNEKSKEDDQDKKEEMSNSEDDEFNVSLAKMEEEIKPKIINILDSLTKMFFL